MFIITRMIPAPHQAPLPLLQLVQLKEVDLRRPLSGSSYTLIALTSLAGSASIIQPARSCTTSSILLRRRRSPKEHPEKLRLILTAWTRLALRAAPQAPYFGRAPRVIKAQLRHRPAQHAADLKPACKQAESAKHIAHWSAHTCWRLERVSTVRAEFAVGPADAPGRRGRN